MGLKEFLSAREVDYVSRDIANDPEAAARFAEVGGELVPAIAKGGSCIGGANLGRVAEFLGLAYRPRSPLGAEVLVERLGHILETAMRLTGQFPVERLASKLPNRDRTLLALANHIVEVAAGYLVVEAGEAFDRVVAGAVPNRELERDSLATRSRSICARLAAKRPDPARQVETYFGSSDLHHVLERCTWHAAQHVRQLAFMLERFGIEPDRPLDATDLQGLPVPAAVWDDPPA